MESTDLMWVVRKLAELEAEHRALGGRGTRKLGATGKIAAEWQAEPDLPASVKLALEAITK